MRTLLLWFLLVFCGPVSALPSYNDVKQGYAASDIRILDRQGRLIERVRRDFSMRRGAWVALVDVSVALQRAVILSEDRRFYSHAGIDWQAMLGAAWANLTQDRLRGASTISMQLLALIDDDYRRGPGGRSIVQKIDQALDARELDAQWSKQDILEAYLNLAAFRGEVVGVDALAHVLFQKHPSGLNLRESALAAVLLRGPNAPPPVLQQRTCALLREMGAPSECTGLNDFIYIVLSRKAAAWADTRSEAPHFARLALLHSASPVQPGQGVVTSLDADLQRFVLDSVARRLRALDMANVRDAAVVVQDNRSGEILAYVGSSGELSVAARVDHARSLRQAGSALKPFLYQEAIAQRRLTAVSLLDDAPLNVATGNGLYIPKNYDQRFAGWVSVRTALASSLNIPAVRTLMMITPDVFARKLVRLGLPLEQEGDFYGYSLALGSADVTLLSLTNAYRALANLGHYSEPRYFPPEAAGRVVRWPYIENDVPAQAGAAWIVGDILSDRQARARTFGLDSPLSTPFWSAVKTGTSKDMRDNWCLGWSSDYTVGVWVGNSGGGSMHDVSGVSGAGPIWHDIMSYLHRQTASRQPPMPASVTRVAVTFEQEIEPGRLDVFLDDTAMSHVRLVSTLLGQDETRSRIASPANGAILALDPDIPADKQKLWLRAVNMSGSAPKEIAWRIDANPLDDSAQDRWSPLPGRHRIELLDAAGHVMDAVRIEVRGLPGAAQ